MNVDWDWDSNESTTIIRKFNNAVVMSLSDYQNRVIGVNKGEATTDQLRSKGIEFPEGTKLVMIRPDEASQTVEYIERRQKGNDLRVIEVSAQLETVANNL